jgi:nitrogen-specific signal transduction histidine kinase
LNSQRAKVEVHDSGPGIPDGYEERIFWPGVTRKPEGLGMGLTVASEIISQYGGKIYLIKPGLIGGASFGFDLPITTRVK